MNRVRLDNTTRIVIIIILLFFAVFIVMEFFVKKEKQNTKESRTTLLFERLQKLQEQIQIELTRLRLTRQMEAFLEQKVNRMFFISKVAFIVLFVLITIGFLLNGQDIITAALSSAGTIAFTSAAAAFIFFNKFSDPNEIINAGRNVIRRMIYKKYDFDPGILEGLQVSIAAKERESSEIQKELELPIVSGKLTIE